MSSQDRTRAIEILDGSMLGDGNLSRWGNGAHYKMALSKPLVSHDKDTELVRHISLQEHLKYERWLVEKAFSPLGIPISRDYPKILTGISKGKPYQYACLSTRQSLILLELYNEWYTGGEWVNYHASKSHVRGATKRLPERLLSAGKLPLPTLVSWFIEDGGSSWVSPAADGPRVRVSFSVHNFTTLEVYHLADMVNNMGIKVLEPRKDKRVNNGSGLVIWLSDTGDNVDCFMDLLEPHMVEIFDNSVGPSYRGMIKRELRVSVKRKVCAESGRFKAAT